MKGWKVSFGSYNRDTGRKQWITGIIVSDCLVDHNNHFYIVARVGNQLYPVNVVNLVIVEEAQS